MSPRPHLSGKRPQFRAFPVCTGGLAPPGSHLLGPIFGLGRLDVVECAVSPLIWGLKPAEVRMGNYVCRAVYGKSSEKSQ